MKKQQKAFILYEYTSFDNDFKFIKEYYNKEEIEKEFKLSYNSIYNYTTKSLKNINKLLENKYIIFIDNIKI